MAEGCTLTEKTSGSVKSITFAWTTAADGTCTQATTEKYDGQVIFVCTDPGATAPTDNYDIALNDDNGVDVLAGAGANRDTADTEYIAAKESLGAVANSILTMEITNAGDSKIGTLYVYIR